MRSWPGATECTPATSCCGPSGATARTGTRGRSTCMSGICARSSRPGPRSPSSSSPYAGPGTASASPDVRIGLRARYVAVLALVSALTLAVAAVALFSPLDRQLRDAERDALRETVRTEVGDFADLPASALRPGSPRLRTAMRGLRRSGVEVAVLDRSGQLLATTDPDPQESFAAA